MTQKYTTIDNRRARFDYHLGDKIIAGISLKGAEVKAIRQQKVSLKEAFINIDDNSVWVKNLAIFSQSNQSSSSRTKNMHRLLLTKSQIKNLSRQLDAKYNTIVITRLILGKYIKLEIAPAKGKKLYDKREVIKERDSQRQIRRRLN